MSAAVVMAGFALFVIYTALRAISESWNNENFPEALGVKLVLLPVIFPLHMVTGGLALLLVPATLCFRRTSWHRTFGRVTAIDVVIAGVTAIPVALAQPVTWVSAAGFTVQGLLWMALLTAGLWNMLQGRYARHRRLMLLMAAVTSGALFFRIYLALWALYGWRGGFTTFYACDAWIAWGLPLLIMLGLTRRSGGEKPLPPAGLSA